MNIASPFQAAAEEGFTIRELSILLPPQLLKSEGLPPDYLIPLPLESLRTTFLQGRPCLRLSQIFQSCPYLFNRQLMAGEDQEVALPYQKVRRILESAGMPQAAPRATQPIPNSPPVQANSPFQVREPALDRSQASPFSLAPQSEQVVLKPQDNPFQMAHPQQQSAPQPPQQQHAQPQPQAPAQPPAPAQMASPFQVANSLPAHPQGPMQPSHPFPQAQQNGPSNSPFQIANPGQSPFGLPQAPQQQPPQPQPQQQSPFKPQANFAESSPFQVAAPSPGFPQAPAAQAPPQQQPAPQQQINSPFSMADPASAPSNERPPAFPAPHSSSPFQIAQQPAPQRPAPQLPSMEASPFRPAEHLPPPPAQAPAPVLPPLAKPHQQHAPQGPGSLPAMAPIQQFPVPQQDAPRERQPNERPFSPPILKRSEPPVSGSPLPPLQPAEPVAAPQLPPFTPPVAPTVSAPEPVAQEETRTVSLRLRSVLQNASVEDLGFDPANVPDAVMVKFPLPLIMSQLPSGKVVVQISHVTEGVADKFRPAFSRSRADAQLSLPLSELFHAMPPDSIPSAPQPKPVEPPKQNPIFTTPFQNVAAEDATRVAKPAPILPPLPAPSREAQEQAEASMSSFLASHEDLGKPRSAETLTEAPPATMALRGAAQAPVNEPVLTEKISLPEITPPVGGLPPLLPSQLPKRDLQPPPQAQPQLPPPPQPQQHQAPAPVQLPPLQPMAPAVQAVAAPKPAPAPAPVAPPKHAAPADAQDLQFGYQERPEMMAVRYLLESPTDMNLGQIAERLAQLNGLCASVIISPEGQDNGGSNEANAEVFFNKAGKSHQSLIALAESIGMPPHGAFTLRADQMVRTFFIEGDICIAVLHSESTFAPGVRDKLILLTRELAKLHA